MPIPRPATTPVQEDLYAQLQAWTDADPANAWALLKYIGAWASMADQIEEYARDTDAGEPGWSLLVDIERCPPEALPFLGQFVGVDVTNFARIVVLGANEDTDPMGQTAGTAPFPALAGGPGTGAPHALPDGAVPIDTAAQTIVDKSYKALANASGNAGYWQPQFVIPGKTYNVSMDAYTPGGHLSAFYVVDFTTGLSVVAPVSATPVAAGWFNMNVEFVAPPSGIIALIGATQTLGSGGPAWYSNFQIRQVRPETDAEYFARMRDTIRSTGGFYRGSPAALRAAAQQFLTGSKTVIFRERDPGPAPVYSGAYGLTVITYGTETPDQAKVLKALLAQKPAGIILDYEVIDGTVYLVIRTLYPTYTAVRAAYLTYNGLRNNAPGT